MDANAGNQSTDQLIGQTVGNYLVTQKLGEGGMGSVYLAEHPTIGKKVALKVLHAEFSSNADVAARFFNEAKAVNDIGHPNIVDIVDFGILQGMLGREQLVYFIMEYLNGISVTALIRHESPLPPERALGLALQVADALAASHKCGIVHRDLKPDNIILVQRAREKDFVKLLDFGIAKLTGENAGGNRTRTGIVMGTPAYMSPEQCDGKGLVDHRTDIYALGILLYEMLTGRVPFIGEGYGEVLVQHLTQKPLPPSQYRMLPPHVEIVVLKALEKRQDMRYPTMEEFMRAMADPVGYVEANGGLQGFLGRQLMPSTAPIELPQMRLTPAPRSSPNLTPPPGSITPMPALQTMGGAQSVIGGQPARPPSRVGFWIAGVLVIAAAVGAIVVLSQRAAGTTTASAGSGGAVTGSAGSAAVAVATPSGSGSGSGATASDRTIPHDTATPANPDSVDIALTSAPAGAAIFVDGVDQKVVTPTTLHLKRSTSPSMISFRLDGYVNESRQVRLDEGNTKEEATLDKRPTAGSGAGSAAPLAAGSAAGSGSAATPPVKPPVTPPFHHILPVTPPAHHHTPVTPPQQGSAHHDADGLAKPGDL